MFENDKEVKKNITNITLREEKPSYDEQRCTLGKVLPLDTPFRICLELSEKCNFKCNYCFRAGNSLEKWGRILPNENMSMDTFKLAVQQLKAFPSSPRLIALSACGEPLCNTNIVKMVNFLRKEVEDSKIEITTNASLLTKDNVKEIAECGINKIVISLQGLDSQTYKEVCGVSINFAQFYENLTLLYANKSNHTKIFVKIVDSALSNQGQEERFFSMFESIADRMFIEKVVSLWQEQNYCESDKKTVNKYGEDFGKIECCTGPFTSFIISPNGFIWPCCFNHPPVCFGNIREISLVDAWNDVKRKEFLRQQLIDKNFYKQCATCYFPQVYVKTEQDIISPYKDAVLEKLL